MAGRDRSKGYATIAKAAIDDDGLSNADLRVLMALGYFADKDGRCWPSGTTIARKARTARSHVWNRLKRLKALGYISVSPRGYKNKCNLYTVHGIEIGTATVPSIGTATVPKVGTVTVPQTPQWNTKGNTTTDGPSQQAAPALFSFDANSVWFKDNAWAADRVEDLPAVVDRCWHIAGESGFNARQLVLNLSQWADRSPEKASRVKDVGAFYVRRFQHSSREANRRDAALGGLDDEF